MTDDWKGSHRGFQDHKKKNRRRSSSSSNSNGLRSRRKIGTRSTLYWAMIKYGRDYLMLAMSSYADEYDSERHSGCHCPPRRLSNRKSRAGSTSPSLRFDHWA